MFIFKISVNSCLRTTNFKFFENNFQYGLKFETPIFLRQARANYKTAQLKIASTQLEKIQKQVQLQVKVKTVFNNYSNLKNQLQLQTSNYLNYQKLLQAEETKLQNGESSLFFINTRENKALESFQKLLDVKIKYYKSIFALQWSAGLLQ